MENLFLSFARASTTFTILVDEPTQMAGGRQVEPVSGAVLLPLSETKPVDERRASLGTCSNGAATDSSRHPFKEKHPLLQRCETVLTSSLLPSLVLALLFFGAVAALTLVEHADGPVLDDPAIHSSAVIVGYVSFELLTVRVAQMSYVQRFLRPLPSTAVSCALMHAAFAWCAWIGLGSGSGLGLGLRSGFGFR